MNNKHQIIVGIGASAGGLNALQEFFASLPVQPDIAFVVIMHLHPDHTSHLATILQDYTLMPVIRIERNIMVKPGNIYVITENTYITLRNGELVVKERGKDLINRAINTFFISMAADAGTNAVGIVLSGTGTDGLEGSKAIEKNGGFVMVQHPDSTQFNGMPMSIIHFDHPDVIDTPQKLSQFIADYSFSFRQDMRA